MRMRGHGVEGERRRTARVAARGSVLVHGDLPVRGRIADVSCGGVRIEPFAGSFQLRRGARCNLELRLDGLGVWVKLYGVVRRRRGGMVSIAFDRAPAELEDAIHDELLARLECAAIEHVLVVDGTGPRRVALAGRLRMAGRHVTDVASTLQAIHHLGESQANPRWIVVAGLSRAAAQLRSYLAVEHPSIPVVSSRRAAAWSALDPASRVDGRGGMQLGVAPPGAGAQP